MGSLEDIAAETLEAVRKAQTSGVTTQDGLFGYDLSGVISLVPVNTPTFDRTARKAAPQGSDAATWRALLNVNNAQPNPFVGRDYAGGEVQVSTQNVVSTYQPVRVSGLVTRDSITYGRNYTDAKAIATIQTMMQWRIQDNKALLGGQNYALPTIGTVTLTQSDTGGALAASYAFYVKCAARSPLNYYWGGSGVASASATVTTSSVTGSTHSVTATVPAVTGAVAYDWFTSHDNSTFYYTTTTTVNKAVFTAAPAGSQAVPSGIPDLFQTAPSDTPPTADTSYSGNSYNGYIASILGYYSASGPIVTPGTASSVAPGSYFKSLDGGTLTGTAQGIAELDALNLSIYNTAQLSPSAYVMNAQHASDIAKDVLANPQAVTYLQGNPDSSRRDLTVGASVARYINRASGGDTIDIVVDPHMPLGTIMAITDALPYPNSGASNVFEARCLEDVTQTPYGASRVANTLNGGPRDEWDLSSKETFINRAPVACGILSNVASG
jgi:hypothetical protein